MSATIDYIGQLHPWLTRYTQLRNSHATRLAAYRDDAGEVRTSDLPAYDEARYDTAVEAADFLQELAAFLRELVGPPLPGSVFTLTFAGVERHDGEKSHSFVVNGSDLPDAGRALLNLPLFRDWCADQCGGDRARPDVLYLAGESHPGIPEHGYFTDLRRSRPNTPAPPQRTAALPRTPLARPHRPCCLSFQPARPDGQPFLEGTTLGPLRPPM